MAETFPIQCGSCTEIVDVATHMVVGAAYNCPMCGADTAIAEAEDFDLPCPAEVVIEEHTAERLRFRLPRCLPGSDRQVGGWLSLLATVVVLFVGIVMWIATQNPQQIYGVVPFVGVCSLFFALGLINLRGYSFFDITRDCLTVRHYLGPFGINLPYKVVPFRDVYMHFTMSVLTPFRGPNAVVCVKSKWWPIRFAESQNPDIARYVTHLIRRQLITMGHKLQDG